MIYIVNLVFNICAKLKKHKQLLHHNFMCTHVMYVTKYFVFKMDVEMSSLKYRFIFIIQSYIILIRRYPNISLDNY